MKLVESLLRSNRLNSSSYLVPGKQTKLLLLHIPPVLPADLKQRVGNLPERAVFYRFYQSREATTVSAKAFWLHLQPLAGSPAAPEVDSGNSVARLG